MPRFFFDLVGPKLVADDSGLTLEDARLAARLAEQLARELSDARPELRGSASVIVSDRGANEFTYCVAIR
jgi:hypothetical protein